MAVPNFSFNKDVTPLFGGNFCPLPDNQHGLTAFGRRTGTIPSPNNELFLSGTDDLVLDGNPGQFSTDKLAIGMNFTTNYATIPNSTDYVFVELGLFSGLFSGGAPSTFSAYTFRLVVDGTQGSQNCRLFGNGTSFGGGDSLAGFTSLVPLSEMPRNVEVILYLDAATSSIGLIVDGTDYGLVQASGGGDANFILQPNTMLIASFAQNWNDGALESNKCVSGRVLGHKDMFNTGLLPGTGWKDLAGNTI